MSLCRCHRLSNIHQQHYRASAEVSNATGKRKCATGNNGLIGDRCMSTSTRMLHRAKASITNRSSLLSTTASGLLSPSIYSSNKGGAGFMARRGLSTIESIQRVSSGSGYNESSSEGLSWPGFVLSSITALFVSSSLVYAFPSTSTPSSTAVRVATLPSTGGGGSGGGGGLPDSGGSSAGVYASSLMAYDADMDTSYQNVQITIPKSDDEMRIRMPRPLREKKKRGALQEGRMHEKTNEHQKPYDVSYGKEFPARGFLSNNRTRKNSFVYLLLPEPAL